jgi:glycosyltransferase-like protein
VTSGGPRIALVTYSTKPRGGVVHTLSLAEALFDAGVDVHVITLGDPAVGFYRPTRVPTVVVPSPPKYDRLEDRIFASIDALEAGLRNVADRFDVLHTQDCISARAAARVRDDGAAFALLRTVHHIDDFTTEVLINCQNQAIQEPDRVLVVSDQWRRILLDEHGVVADIVPNGVDAGRFGPISAARRTELRRRIGAETPDGQHRFVFLSVGGIEPRKGTMHLVRALAEMRGTIEPAPLLAIVGDHSFQDYRQYRDTCLKLLDYLDLEIGRDVILLGEVADSELPEWYRAADALAFPSTKEGWGLAVLEAMAAELPVVTSDLPVFHEYLTDGVDALMTPTRDVAALAQALARIASSPALRATLVDNAQPVVERFSWPRSAARHQEIYAETCATRPARV